MGYFCFTKLVQNLKILLEIEFNLVPAWKGVNWLGIDGQMKPSHPKPSQHCRKLAWFCPKYCTGPFQHTPRFRRQNATKFGESIARRLVLPAIGKGKLDRQPDLHDGEDSRLNVVFNFIPDMHSREGAKKHPWITQLSMFHVTNFKKQSLGFLCSIFAIILTF